MYNGLSICGVRDFERISYQNSREPNMRFYTNIKQIVKESNRRFGGANFLQKTSLKRLKPLCCMIECYKLGLILLCLSRWDITSHEKLKIVLGLGLLIAGNSKIRLDYKLFVKPEA